MKSLKDLVYRKHNLFFLELKNNRYNPMLFFEAVSLADSFLCKLSEKQKQIRVLCMQYFIWHTLEKCLHIDAELKSEYNTKVKSNYAVSIAPVIQVINDCMMEDEPIISEFYRKFKVEKKIDEKKISYPDIKQKWSVGVVKNA